MALFQNFFFLNSLVFVHARFQIFEKHWLFWSVEIYCQLCKIITLLITRNANMTGNPAEKDTKFQVNSYISKPGKDFSNQRVIEMGVFQKRKSQKKLWIVYW